MSKIQSENQDDHNIENQPFFLYFTKNEHKAAY